MFIIFLFFYYYLGLGQGRTEAVGAVAHYENNDDDDDGHGGGELPHLTDIVMEVEPEFDRHVERHQVTINLVYEQKYIGISFRVNRLKDNQFEYGVGK